MTGRGRGYHEREKREEAKRSQPPPSLDHLVEVVRGVAGDQAAEQYRALHEAGERGSMIERCRRGSCVCCGRWRVKAVNLDGQPRYLVKYRGWPCSPRGAYTAGGPGRSVAVCGRPRCRACPRPSVSHHGFGAVVGNELDLDRHGDVPVGGHLPPWLHRATSTSAWKGVPLRQ
jgi:hypothetical protein